MHMALTSGLRSVEAPANMQFPFHGEKDKYGSCAAKKVVSPGFSSCWVCVAGRNLTRHLLAKGERKPLSFCMFCPWKLSGQINEHREMTHCWDRAALRSVCSKSRVGAASLVTKPFCGYVDIQNVHLQDCNLSAFIGSCISA